MKGLEYLTDSVRRGQAALFLGSGALIGATLGGGKSIPLGNDLRDLISDKFLRRKFKTDSLQHVAALAISQHSLHNVQDFIKEHFADLSPAPFQYKIPDFIWKAIFTTNYDRLIETVYDAKVEKAQNYLKILSNKDQFSEFNQSNSTIPLVKLHGCITRTHDENLPLILTVDQYNESLKGHRENLFNYLYELSINYPIIFIGHSLQDSNVRAILLDVHKQAPNGQRHYFLKPGLEEEEKNFWAARKISAYDCTFQNLLEALSTAVTEQERTLSLAIPNRSISIEKRFTTRARASDLLIHYLSESAEHISSESTYTESTPDMFYKGSDLGWYPIAKNLNIKRTLETKIESEVLNKAEAERNDKTELVVIKGEAGSGKTVILRSLAWENRSAGFGVILWINTASAADISAISEICQKTDERVFLVWDNAAINAVQIYHFFLEAQKAQLPVTIITSERNNVWNIRCGDLDNIATHVFDLRYLNQAEIENLIKKLELHNCLGEYLKSKTFEERIIEFREIYGRQILVALYEATKGQNFEEIIFDEYNSIPDLSSKELYRTICTLNRLRVPVRAGLISRIHNISFDDFSKKFFKPLEKIVLTESLNDIDAHYRARHPEIAEIIFRRTLVSNLDRFNEYLRILSKINISFESDRNSFRHLIRARTLIDLFPNHQDVVGIYDTAQKNIGEDAYLLQQMANYERLRPDGNLPNALKLLSRAIELAPYDRSLPHTLALTWEARANQATDPTTKIKYRSEAKAVLDDFVKRWGDKSEISNIRVNLLIDNLKDILAVQDSTDSVLDNAIRSIESLLIETQKKFPSDSHLLTTEANFAKLLNDNKRALAALEKSFEANDTDPYIASRLTRLLEKNNQKDKASAVLKRALDRRPADQALNFQYAEQLRKNPTEDFQNIAYYYNRAYTPNDFNFEAQFWHARFLYDPSNSDNQRKALKIFQGIRKSRIPFRERVAIKDFIGSEKAPKIFHGELIAKRGDFGFIRVDGSGEDIFVSGAHFLHDLWDAIKISDRLKFKIGFTYNGIVCFDVLPE